jgi:hypothetical protein
MIAGSSIAEVFSRRRFLSAVHRASDAITRAKAFYSSSLDLDPTTEITPASDFMELNDSRTLFHYENITSIILLGLSELVPRHQWPLRQPRNTTSHP